ncbi:MAG TPA: pyruvate formate-lyase-activating protein [Syntrophomonadaceae bacterium]|nr:pyruvate formate-lyase-activating protein [Syntrophomonadaceae bacterium]
MQGLVHSIDTFSTLDGPGIRTLIFLQGCHLRCKYCHNPDAWAIKSAKARTYTVAELMQIIMRAKPYFTASNGGITFSGGEPLLQAPFVKKVFQECRENNIHTAFDSSLYVKSPLLEEVLAYTDLVLADIKHMDPSNSQKLTGLDNMLNIKNLNFISAANVPIWIRYVIVPGLTDNADDIVSLAQFIKGLSSVERIDLLPYHTLGVHKWELLNLKYELNDIEVPTPGKIASIQKQIAQITNIQVYANI